MSWYRQAATNNQPHACFYLALGFREEKTNHEAQIKAYRYMLQAAQAGHREAQFEYGLACLHGDGVRKNIKQGAEWLIRSAEAGWPRAEFKLATFYLNGVTPFPKDVTQGEIWLERAAEHGNLEAQFTLGTRLMNGTRETRNPMEAVKWWRSAAEHGYAKAQNDLGYAIEKGDAGKTDLVEACMWFLLASKGGVGQAQANLADLSSNLTVEQYKEASQRVQEFHPQSVPFINPVKMDNSTDIPPLDMNH
jgi:TPR repeat protein